MALIPAFCATVAVGYSSVRAKQRHAETRGQLFQVAQLLIIAVTEEVELARKSAVFPIEPSGKYKQYEAPNERRPQTYGDGIEMIPTAYPYPDLQPHIPNGSQNNNGYDQREESG
jgi:hypothetical protein